MANNRFSADILGRKTGGSILTRAAYSHRDQYRDERTGKLTADNRADRSDLEWEGLFAPDVQNVPEWWYESRERIFNELEKREDRSTRPHDAQLAYDFKLSLPHELSPDGRRELITEWALLQTARGYVVDVALHKPNPRENDERNTHAHILMPLRPISEQGWGNKFRAPGDSRRDFEKWASENLRTWKEEFSELGARYLERAGERQEAERFKVGHLSRPDRANAAHARGDTEAFERLLDEPQRYLGPAAAARERSGQRSRTGDTNREIKQRNEFHGPIREIRRAYLLAHRDRDDFLKLLSEQDIVVARISKDDERHQQLLASRTLAPDSPPKYRPHRTGDHVLVTEPGQVYRLTPTTTNDNWKEIGKMNRSMSALEFPDLATAIEQQKQRSLIPKLDRAVISESNTKLTYPTLAEAMLSASLRQLAPHSSASTDVLDKRTDAQKLWDAYNSTTTPEAFRDRLAKENFSLARVTAEDAAASQIQHWASKRAGRYFPILNESEYIVHSERGFAYRLNAKTVGHNPREIKAFMSGLDDKPMPSYREAEAKIEEKRIQQIMSRSEDQSEAPSAGRKDREIPDFGRATEAILSGGFEFVAAGFESLFTPSRSPEQKPADRLVEHERQAADDRAEKQRRYAGMER